VGRLAREKGAGNAQSSTPLRPFLLERNDAIKQEVEYDHGLSKRIVKFTVRVIKPVNPITVSVAGKKTPTRYFEVLRQLLNKGPGNVIRIL